MEVLGMFFSFLTVGYICRHKASGPDIKSILEEVDAKRWGVSGTLNLLLNISSEVSVVNQLIK